MSITAQIYGRCSPDEIEQARNSRHLRRILIIDWLRDSGQIGLEKWLLMQTQETFRAYEAGEFA